MSRVVSTLLAFLLLLAAALPVAAEEPKPGRAPVADLPPMVSGAPEVVAGEVIVKFRDERRAGEVLRARGLTIAAEVGAPGKGLPDVVSTGGRPVQDVINELAADPAVEYAEPSYRVQVVQEGSVTGVAVSDPLTGNQYSLDRMRVRDAWTLSKGGSGLIAVLDTGVQGNHPDLAGRVIAGYDFVNNDSNAVDDNGHGTWVAGVIAGNTNDGYGIAGISWTDRILPVKIMNDEGLGNTTALLNGIVYAADRGATVINMSVGGFPYSQGVQDAVNYAWNKGAVLVGAAGNNNLEERFYPASMANVVSVSATQLDDEFSHWSSYGPAVDVSAPGSSIQTANCTVCTRNSHSIYSHIYVTGTSFATPNVAGVVALIRARYPSWTPAQVVDRLYATVDDLGFAGWDNRYGRGRVNAYRALGGSVQAAARPAGDALEGNNGLSAARPIPLGTATRPTIYPASDVDFLAVDVPRAGRLDVRVTGVVDGRVSPWTLSSLPIDPVVELYDTAGRLLQRVDAVWEDGTELAQVSVAAPTRIIVRINNYYANGNRTAYSITPTFVDTVPPALSAQSPGPNAVKVRYDGAITATFNEPVTGVGTATVQLRDAAGRSVAAAVTYSSSTRRATLMPSAPLAPEAKYSVHLTTGIKDSAGNAFAGASWSFTTGKAVPRVAGSNAFDTAAAVSRTAFSAGVPVVYVATVRTYPDALAGGPAARAGGGPILFTDSASLPAATAAELSRLQPRRIVVLGGTSAISSSVVGQLDQYTAGSVTRIAGADRYATAAAISRATFAAGAPTVYVATGENYPDALAAAAVAARAKAPILLVRQGTIPSVTATELSRLRPGRIILMGGPVAIGDAVARQLTAYAPVTRVAGADRYGTAVALSQLTFGANAVSSAYVATGQAFTDGLAAGPVAGLRGSPLLLTPPTYLPEGVATELRRLDPTSVVIVGGTGAVSNGVREAILALWR